MCGFVGFIVAHGNAKRNAHIIIEKMTASLRLRGPDGDGVWVGENVALGHRRLAIMDLSSAGAQPMLSACGRLVIALNGEIYNHLDLRRELEFEGTAPPWRGYSDTETLLAAILHWGLDETLKRTAGMFAIALWDKKSQCLSLARDRMGEKPVYWGWAGRTLVFGSELKALRKHPDFSTDICRQATAQYLRFGYVPAPRSIHPSIYKLEPGCILEVDRIPPPTAPDQPLRPGDNLGSLSIRRYWSLNDTIESGANSEFKSETEALVALEATMNTAIKRQMIADVPLGAFLSGGIDSSLIVGLMQQQSSRPVKTFTVGFEDAGFDESHFAAAVARHLGTDHTEIIVTDADARRVIPQLPDLYDEPFADSSQIPTHIVCRAARQHVAVALSGDAGDELFGGYNRYFWGPKVWNRLEPIPFLLRRIIGAGITAIPLVGWDGIGRAYNRFRSGSEGIDSVGEKAHRFAARLGYAKDMDGLYRSLVSGWMDPTAIVLGSVEPSSLLDDPLPAALNADPAAWMMAQDMRSYLPDDILCKVDRAAMGVSLETRVPFLDPDVIALSFRLPMKMKIRGATGKWALRQVLYRHVPRELIERPKTGFGIPVGDWLRGPLRDWAEDLLAPEALSADGLLDPGPIRQSWAEHLSGRRDWTQRLWTILMLQAWRERWK